MCVRVSFLLESPTLNNKGTYDYFVDPAVNILGDQKERLENTKDVIKRVESNF